MSFETGNCKCMITVNYWDDIRREIKDILDGEYSEEGLQRLQGVLEECKRNITETFCYSVTDNSLSFEQYQKATGLLEEQQERTHLWEKLKILLNESYDEVIGPDKYGLFTVRCFNENREAGEKCPGKEEIKKTEGKHSGIKEVIPPVYDYGSIVEVGGLEGVYKARKNRGDSLIRKDGSVIFDSNEYFIKERKDFKHEFYDIYEFKEAEKGKVAIISISKGHKKCYGLINENGEVYIEPKYGGLNYVGGDYCEFRNYKNSKPPIEGYVDIRTGDKYLGEKAKAIKSKIENDKRIE